MPLLTETMYDKNMSGQSSCIGYLEVEAACLLAPRELKVCHIFEPLPVWFTEDLDPVSATIDYQLLLFSLKERKQCSTLTSNGKSSVILSEGNGKLMLIDTHNDILSNCGSNFVTGNVQQLAQLLRKEALQFPYKLRYGVLTVVEFLT